MACDNYLFELLVVACLSFLTISSLVAICVISLTYAGCLRLCKKSRSIIPSPEVFPLVRGKNSSPNPDNVFKSYDPEEGVSTLPSEAKDSFNVRESDKSSPPSDVEGKMSVPGVKDESTPSEAKE